MAARRDFPAITVRQWLPSWDLVEFEAREHRRKPDPTFYLFSMPARLLRRLTGIYRRETDAVVPRAQDLGIQRRHEQDRSDEIREFVNYGYPWSDLSPAKRAESEFADLRKPGWLPTSIVVNIVKAGEHRRSQTMSAEDAISIDHRDDEIARIRLPTAYRAKWEPRVRPLEVIDGQHRLWAFSETEGDDDFELPVVAFHGLDISWQAYLFWTINIKPKRINPSLAFDLYPLLRTEDWLERFSGHSIYRETRAQELVEALWSHPSSPWRERIDMLGVRRLQVSQAAWVRSLMATFVKSWKVGTTAVGGLFGAPVGSDQSVLPWDRAQQAAFLIMVWRELADAIGRTSAPWARRLRELAGDSKGDDPAFFGRHALISTDQGVRGVLAIANDFFVVRADELRLAEWGATASAAAAATDEERVKRDLASLSSHRVTPFWRDVAEALAKYDWRTSSFPGLSRTEQTTKAALRGAGGYRELRLQLLELLSSQSGTVAQVAADVRSKLE